MSLRKKISRHVIFPYTLFLIFLIPHDLFLIYLPDSPFRKETFLDLGTPFPIQRPHPFPNPLMNPSPPHSPPVNRSDERQPPLVTIDMLLAHSDFYHQKLIRCRGLITQPELHLDDTSLFIDFVFVLRDGLERVVVFGRHDRTQGDIQIQLDRMVEVTGLFWKTRESHGMQLTNNLEAISVKFFPDLYPDTT